ncbi:filamentous hemagglutinin family outer membrane protein [[Leptolyngbya] sp. PCC 7376]|uniref:CHAT domain-containing protein n=1 Tax=[Leptolyngbya] sp. PCC 7376 TaxID=111781 RepID=UPI00029F4D79|nr:CHAT domain-containing protein [[Leptolyngbya] sp. PCC 7376]AFY38249.1 filamentous hemagglutinin family outer membrane protein [[Leptolyngbya] sp. PCC 7376]
MNDWRQILLSLFLGIFPFVVLEVAAQPIQETNNLTQTNVTELGSDQFVINGGIVSRDGQNLFHGFDAFNLDANQAAIFLNSPNASNLFSKISGGTPSFIDGLIGVAQGNPDLYFINPAGLIFGKNAQLNVPSAFVGTTATALGFDNGWLNVVGSSDFANLVGEPSLFSFNTNGVVGDILVQGNLETPVGDIGLIGGRIQGDRRISTPADLLVTTVTDQSIVRLQQPGNLLSIELDTTSLDNGNTVDFSVNQLPQLLTGIGEIQLNEVAAQYGLIAADGQLTLNNSDIQTAGHLTLLGQGITTNSTSSDSGLNQLLISGELSEIYQAQKPFLTAIANKINFAIEADPIDGTPIIVTDDLIDNVTAETLNAADIRLENSLFTGQNIYILGENIDLIGSQLTTTRNLNIFGLDTVELSDSATEKLALQSLGDLSIRGNNKLISNSFTNPDSEIASDGNLFISTGELQLREGTFESQSNFVINGDNILIQNSQLTSAQNLSVNAQNELLLEDVADQERGENFTSDKPLRLIAGNNLTLRSEEVFRAIAPKADSLFRAGNQILVTNDDSRLDVLGNFTSDGSIQIGDRTNSTVQIEGGTWQAAGDISLLAQDNLILQDFHETEDNYGRIGAPLNINADQLNFAGDNLIEIYLGQNSSIKSTQDLTLANSNNIRVTGSVASEGNLNIAARNIDIGVNLDRVGGIDGRKTLNIGQLRINVTPIVPAELAGARLDAFEDGRFVENMGRRFVDEAYWGGNFSAGGDLTFTAEEALTLSDYERQPLTLTGQNIYLSGDTGQNFSPFFDQGLLFDLTNDSRSNITATKDISFESNQFIGRVGGGIISAGEDIQFFAPIIALQGSQITAGESISFTAPELLQLESLNDANLFSAIAPQINFSPSNEINIDLVLDNLTGGKIESGSNLAISSLGNLSLSGEISAAENLSIDADNNATLVFSQLTAGEDLSITAGGQLSLTDIRKADVRGNIFLHSPNKLITTNGDITLQGGTGLSIESYDVRSFIQSGSDTTLISDGTILSNIRYQVGNDFAVRDLSGSLADWESTVNVNSNNSNESLQRQIGGTFLPIGQVNLAQINTGGDIAFNDFTGRSLILNAEGTITAGSIHLDIPVAYGFPDDGSMVRTKNHPDILLSVTGNDPGLVPLDISIAANAADMTEENAILDGIQLNFPYVLRRFPLNLDPIPNDGDTFVASRRQQGIEQPGSFIIAPLSSALDFNPLLSDGLNSAGVSLNEIDNPVAQASNQSFAPITGTRGTGLSQDLIEQQENNKAIAAISEEKPEETSIAVCTGVDFTSSENDEKFISCQQNNLRVAKAAQDIPTQLATLGQLGSRYYQKNMYSQALAAYQERQALAQSTQNLLAEAESLQGLTQTYSALGDYAAARDANFQTSTLLAQLEGDERSNPNQLIRLKQAIANNAGLIAYAQKSYDLAVEQYKEGLQLAQDSGDRPTEIEILSQLGLSYFQQTDYVAAKETQSKALSLAKNEQSIPNQLRAYEGLAIAEYALENYDVAINHFERALTLSEQVGDRHAQARNWSALGDAQYKTQQNSAAIGSLENAIQLWEDLRANLGDQDLFRVSLFETQETTYSTLQEVLIESGQFIDALEVSERGRSRAFVELLDRGLAPQAKTQDIDAPDIAQMRRIAAEQQATLVSYSIGRQIIDSNGQREQIDSEIWIWVVQPDGSMDFRRQDLQAITAQGLSVEDLVSDSRCFGDRLCMLRSQSRRGGRGLSSNGQADISDPHLAQLHQLLIAPIEDLLPTDTNKEVVFIPHRALFLVPFAALQDSTGRYLIEDHTIRTAPSIQVLDLTHQQRQKVSGEGITIVGNPTMPQGLEQLPGAETEAQAIAAIFDTEFITGDDATPTLVSQTIANSRIIHLATHGLLDGLGDNDAQKIPGAIALAPTEADDGFLTASEILELKLNSEMVVLSACDTGRGTITEDGVIGLSRSFMGAGVPSVLVSLWQVPDESTSDLMIEFYGQLQSNPNKARALRQAMLANLQKYGQPRDWAAFTLMGET